MALNSNFTKKDFSNLHCTKSNCRYSKNDLSSFLFSLCVFGGQSSGALYCPDRSTDNVDCSGNEEQLWTTTAATDVSISQKVDCAT